MSKVCRIIRSDGLNRKKFDELLAQAKLLGKLRREVWHRFGSIGGVGADFRTIRNHWVASRNFQPLPAKAWKETLKNTLDDIAMYEESAKKKVKNDIWASKNQMACRSRLKLLKGNGWVKNPYLCRKMRKYKKHGKTRVENQIILEGGVYSQFTGKNGNTWLKVPTFKRGKKLCIPLNSNVKLTGALRLILKDGICYVHYSQDQKSFRPCGSKVIGVDQGYTEAFADSDGEFYGLEFGKILTDATEKVHQRGKARNRLYQIAKKNPKKRDKILKYNLGRKKLDRFYNRKKQKLRCIAYESAHRLVDKAKEVRAEDLSKPFSSKKNGKKYNRKMSGWAKGSLAEALESVTKARGSCLRFVNAAYTSQMDSKTGHLKGRRVGDKFYHVNGEVSHADTNAAVNIKHRFDDTEIGLYTPYKEVKAILLNRLAAIGGVSNSDRPSLTLVVNQKWASTESELRDIHQTSFE